MAGLTMSAKIHHVPEQDAYRCQVFKGDDCFVEQRLLEDEG